VVRSTRHFVGGLDVLHIEEIVLPRLSDAWRILCCQEEQQHTENTTVKGGERRRYSSTLENKKTVPERQGMRGGPLGSKNIRRLSSSTRRGASKNQRTASWRESRKGKGSKKRRKARFLSLGSRDIALRKKTGGKRSYGRRLDPTKFRA